MNYSEISPLFQQISIVDVQQFCLNRRILFAGRRRFRQVNVHFWRSIFQLRANFGVRHFVLADVFVPGRRRIDTNAFQVGEIVDQKFGRVNVAV